MSVVHVKASDDTPCMRIEIIERLRGKRTMNLDVAHRDKDWKYAFHYYNYHTHSDLKMGCRPCYFKVFAYIEDHFKKNGY